jgi:hypothetical protein
MVRMDPNITYEAAGGDIVVWADDCGAIMP